MALGLGFSAGCVQVQHYDGPEQPKENTAQLKTTNSWLSVNEASVVFRKIDGKKIRRFTRSIELLPGMHEIEATCYWLREGHLVPLHTGVQIMLSANQRYYLYSVPRSTGCDVEIENFAVNR